MHQNLLSRKRERKQTTSKTTTPYQRKTASVIKNLYPPIYLNAKMWQTLMVLLGIFSQMQASEIEFGGKEWQFYVERKVTIIRIDFGEQIANLHLISCLQRDNLKGQRDLGKAWHVSFLNLQNMLELSWNLITVRDGQDARSFESVAPVQRRRGFSWTNLRLPQRFTGPNRRLRSGSGQV